MTTTYEDGHTGSLVLRNLYFTLIDGAFDTPVGILALLSYSRLGIPGL